MLSIFHKSYSNSISRSTITEVNQKVTLFLTPCPYSYKNNKVLFENLHTPFIKGGGVTNKYPPFHFVFTPPPHPHPPF